MQNGSSSDEIEKGHKKNCGQWTSYLPKRYYSRSLDNFHSPFFSLGRKPSECLHHLGCHISLEFPRGNTQVAGAGKQAIGKENIL